MSDTLDKAVIKPDAGLSLYLRKDFYSEPAIRVVRAEGGAATVVLYLQMLQAALLLGDAAARLAPGTFAPIVLMEREDVERAVALLDKYGLIHAAPDGSVTLVPMQIWKIAP